MGRSVRAWAAVVVLAAGLAVTGIGCADEKESSSTGSSSGGGAATEVNVGIIPIVDVAPIYLGKQKGFFKAQKIDLTLVPGSGGAAAVPGVVSGQFKFAFGNLTSLLVANDKGLNLKVVTNGVASTGEEGKDFGAVVAPKGSSIKTAKDLAGKTVAVNNLKNIGDTTVRASVRKAGGDPSDIKFVELAFPDMPAAIQGKKVDAAWVVEPFLSQTRGQGAQVVAWNFVDTAPDLTIAAYFTKADVVEKEADLTKRFKTAMDQSLEYAGSHPDEVRSILLTYTKIPKDVADKITLPKWPAEVNRAGVEQLAKLMTEDKLVEKQPDVGALLP
jgi:NitT/TauT family transport system substrate-binding protein